MGSFGLLPLFTFAFLCHLVASETYWPYGNGHTSRVECQKQGILRGKTWNQDPYINGKGKCWIAHFGRYDNNCLHVEVDDIKMPHYFTTSKFTNSFRFQRADGVGHEQCIESCLKTEGCEFITLGWYRSGYWVNGKIQQRNFHYCRLYKIKFPGARPKMTKDNMDLILVRDQCKMKGASPKPSTPVKPPTPARPECCSGWRCNGYRGVTATTRSGRTCQAWNVHHPHKHYHLTATKKPNAGLDENFCRNPDGEPGGAWCYTTDKKQRWEYCGIPKKCPKTRMP